MAGKPLAREYIDENLDLLRAGLPNMVQHIKNARKYGVPVVVAVNSFATDTQNELEMIRKAAVEEGGALDALVCTHWANGGEGALDARRKGVRHRMAEHGVALRGITHGCPRRGGVAAILRRTRRGLAKRRAADARGHAPSRSQRAASRAK